LIQTEHDYYRQRVAQECAAAEISLRARAREVHLELAELYSEKLRLMDTLARLAAPD
jgi:hypothetical protein